MIDFSVLPENAKKLSQIQIDAVVNRFYTHYLISGNECRYVFDFSGYTWVSNEALLVLSGIMKYLYESECKFFVKFLIDQSTKKIDENKARQYVQIWEVWKIYQVVPVGERDNYFDIDTKGIRDLRLRHGIVSKSKEVYNRYGVTPFKCLNQISEYDDHKVTKMLDDTYVLSDATFEILERNNCHIPFENRTLSYIITKELYENFLDHFLRPHFSVENHQAFLSVLLHGKMNERPNWSMDDIQRRGKENLEEEIFPALHEFYLNNDGTYKNESQLEFSFVDFGNGISKTLRDRFLDNAESKKRSPKEVSDSDVLKYAFQHDSSRYPIADRYSQKALIPRGLFDILAIVQRYGGLLIVRSNNGRIAYDFSRTDKIENAFIKFDDPTSYFPGTLISISIPEQNLEIPFNTTTIKPYAEIDRYSFDKINSIHLSVFEILSKVKKGKLPKEKVYDTVFKLLIEEVEKSPPNSLIYLDFKSFHIDERVARKLLYFISTDYRFNIENNVVVVNPPPLEYLDIIHGELIQLSEIVKSYVIHPTPFVYIKTNGSDTELNVFWLGVFDKEDKDKLNDLLFEIHDLRKTDFKQPDAIVGNVNYYDSQGNLQSYLKQSNIVRFYQSVIVESSHKEIQSLVSKCRKQIVDSVFLCDGNYYQTEYVQLFDVLTNEDECEYLSTALYERLVGFHGGIDNYKILSMKSNGHKISESLIPQELKKRVQVTDIDDPNDIKSKKKISKDDKVILICDVISTGYITTVIEKSIEEVGASLLGVGVLVNAIDPDFEPDQFDYQHLESKTTSLIKIPIKKLRRSSISSNLKQNKLSVIRINPFTNTPITAQLSTSNYEESVLLDHRTFLDALDDNHIKAGFYEFNNLIHPYFFDMDSILSDEKVSFEILNKIFSKIDPQVKKETELVFYPRNCGIKNLDFDVVRNDILKNQNVQFHRLERYSTYEGWRFPHPPEFLVKLSQGKNAMILDDGSCTGESLIQMIDEVAFLGVKRLVVLSIIGRVNNHKREFFSRLQDIAIHNGSIELQILFGSHWNIPTYYLQESPISLERAWLNRLREIGNLPFVIKSIATEVLKEIAAKSVKANSNKHLLKKQDGSSIIKDLILMREHVGKVTSYRFYKDYFEEFDDIIRYYDSKKDHGQKVRYDRIGRLCGVFLHEPYLFGPFRTVMPDVVDKLQEFSLTILLGNPKKPKLPKISKDGLFHKWTNKDIIHLFFTVFSNTELVVLLNTENLNKIIHNHGQNQNDLNYLFYRLLKLFPLNAKESEERIYAEKLIYIIQALAEGYEGSARKNHLKLFVSFLRTLPIHYRTGFQSDLNEIAVNYQKLTDEKFHNAFIHSSKQKLGTQIPELVKLRLSNKSVEEPVSKIKESWKPIAQFIESLLKFSRKHPNFFLHEKGYSALNTSEMNLAKQFSIAQNIIKFNIEELNENFIEMVNRMFREFIDEESFTAMLFEQQSCNVKAEFEKFIDNVKSEFPTLKLTYSAPPNTLVNFPLFYVRVIVFEEFKKNLRHASENSEVTLVWEDSSNMIKLTIINKKSVQQATGGGKGIDRLKRINSYPVRMSYSIDTNQEFVQQTITFNKL